MRTILYLTLFFFAPGLLSAQDTLYKSDGSKYNVKILNINETQVRFKPTADQSGPTYVISKADVLKIVYDAGTVEEFPPPVSRGVIKDGKFSAYKTDPRETDFGRTLFSFTPTDLLFRSLTLSYEHTFESGDFSLRFPVSIGLTSLRLADLEYTNENTGDYYSRNKTFSTGVDFYFYPGGQGQAKFFFGPSFEFGQYKYWSFYYNPPFDDGNSKKTSTYYAFLLQNGFLFQPVKHFNVSINAGIGYSNRRYGTSVIVIRGGLSIGYKF